jgi:uncharacterized protein (DUF111 family)
VTGPTVLMMAQVDDVSGELLGEFIRRAEALGARNIQIVPSLTKKGRPAHIVYVDAPREAEHDVGVLLGSELGTWGYRVLQAEHRHFDIRRASLALRIVAGGATHEFSVRVKVISDGAQVLRVKAEFDDLSSICEALRQAGHWLAIMELKAAVEHRFDRHDTGPQSLELRL